MNILIVPGYGDRTDYICKLTSSWGRQNHHVRVHPFGTVNGRSYEENWQTFQNLIEPDTGIVGISFGATIALRALQDHPDKVRKVAVVSGPHGFDGLSQQTIDTTYPMLNASLGALTVDSIDTTRVRTYAPPIDGVINPTHVPIDGAEHRRVLAAGHSLGIVMAFLQHGREMHDFITS